MIGLHAAPRVQLALSIVIALAFASFYCAAFFPGTLPFDSAYQWWQARGGETSTVHGIGMTVLWRGSDALTEGPAALFLLQLGLFWCGLLLIVAAMPGRPIGRIVFVVAAAFAPVCFVVLSSVVSDAVLMGVLCCAFGLCVLSPRRRLRWSFLLAMALLFLAVLVRKNALPAVIPLAVFAVHREFFAPARLRWRCVVAALCVVILMQGACSMLERRVDQRVTVFAATALWDLAALSIASGELLLPPTAHGPDLDVADLRQAFVPYANTSIFAQTRASITQPFLASDDALNGEVWRAWIAAIREHPGRYLAHRWRVARGLFGSKDPAWPRELVYFPGNTQYRDNPPIALNGSRLHAWFLARFDAARSSQLLAPWPYLLLAVVSAFVAWRRRAAPSAQAALAIIASGLCYVAPLPIIAPSVELRYLGWTCLSAIIGAALAFSAEKPD